MFDIRNQRRAFTRRVNSAEIRARTKYGTQAEKQKNVRKVEMNAESPEKSGSHGGFFAFSAQ
jgi:hypothetical protein